MSVPIGQIAFEIDDVTQTLTVVYLGSVTEQQVFDFYASDGVTPRILEGYDFLIDMRHTKYRAPEGSIARLGAMMRARVGVLQLDISRRRIAMVRRDQPEAFNAIYGAQMRDEFGSNYVRYFDDMEAARAWLAQGRDERATKAG